MKSDDIFAACLQLNTLEDRISQPLMSWTEKKLGVTLEADKFQQVISVMNTSPLEPDHDSAFNAFSAHLLSVDHITEEPVIEEASSCHHAKD